MRRRTFFAWHSWIGLTAGLLLFVICWSGTVAVFSRDIDRLLDPRIAATATSDPIAWQDIYESIREARPTWTVSDITGPYTPGSAAEAWMFDEDQVMRRIYADPVTGEVRAVTSYFNVQRFFRSLHMALFIYEFPILEVPFGYFLVGIFALVLLASLVTSLIFYSRFWRGFFKLQTHRGSKVFWSDAHKLAGLWSLWFTAIIAVTGIWYLVEWWTPPSPPAPEPPAAVAGATPLPLGQLVASAQRAYPELRIRVLGTHSLGDGLLEVQGQDGSLLVRHRAAKTWVNAFTGEPIAVQRPAELTAYQRWIDTADPLHFGDFAGLWSKAVWFLFGTFLSGLCLTGAYLQVKRQQRRGVDSYRLPVRLAYAATVAVLLLSSVHGIIELKTYASGGGLPSIVPAQLAFIIAWIGSTVAILSVWMWKLR